MLGLRLRSVDCGFGQGRRCAPRRDGRLGRGPRGVGRRAPRDLHLMRRRSRRQSGRSDTARGRTEGRPMGEIPYGALRCAHFLTLVFDVGLDRVIAFAERRFRALGAAESPARSAQRMRGEHQGRLDRQNRI